MKHKTVLVASALVVILALVALVPSGLSATTWLTYREDVAINSGTIDLANGITITDTGSSGSYTNITLPCLVSALTNDTTYVNVSATSNQTYNLSVNGNSCNDTSVLNATYFVWNLSDLLSGDKINGTYTYINVSFDFNESANNSVVIHFYASDAVLLTTWLSSNVVVKEKDVTSPYVGTTSGRSFWVVNDSINVSNSLGYTIADVNLTPTFSSQTITAPATYYNVGSIVDGSSAETYAQYQKYGPYVHDIDDDSSGTTHDVTIYVSTNELLTSCVDWSIALNDDNYDDAFDDMNYNTLVVELNGHGIDWDEGSIEIEDFTTQTSYSNNEFTFAWTEAVVPVAPVAVAWHMTLFLGMALYLWIILLVAIVVVIGFVLYIRKK